MKDTDTLARDMAEALAALLRMTANGFDPLHPANQNARKNAAEVYQRARAAGFAD